MNRNFKRTLLAVCAAAAVGATGAVAYAAKGGVENDALAIANAGIPLAQAVTAAEQHAGGKAVKAEFEHAKQGWVFDVEVVAGSKVFDVRVDAASGAVIASSEDKND